MNATLSRTNVGTIFPASSTTCGAGDATFKQAKRKPAALLTQPVVAFGDGYFASL
jgi:hypothetical protein